jgi:hypothetical protein
MNNWQALREDAPKALLPADQSTRGGTLQCDNDRMLTLLTGAVLVLIGLSAVP